MSIHISSTTGVIGIVVALVFLFTRNSKRSVPLPPGPKPLPLVGNVKDMTINQLWLRATEWAFQFGQICYIHVFGQGIVFLNSAEVAFELLDKRGAIYSDKPRSVMVGELCGCQYMMPFLSYGETFKRQRKLMQLTLGPRSIPNYYSMLEQETRSFIEYLLADPANYMRHIRRYSGGTLLSVVYGYKATSSNDEYLVLAEKGMDLLANKMASGLGIWSVDVFPFLRYIPSWFPGASFKRKAVIWGATIRQFAEAPYAYSKEKTKAGTALPSFCSELLESYDELTHEAEDDMKWTANSMYAASADTTISAVCHFLLAMIGHPEVLAKAQKEVDEVVGRGRLPTFSDRPSLPYIECILNETWRWGAPVPLNLPHLLREDDVFQNMFLPKGTLVIANIWAILRDESVYPAASEFRPERFLGVDLKIERKMDPRNYVFGFGRRRCPGADLVESSLWLLIVTMIASLDISKERDAAGNEVDPVVTFDSNLFFRTPAHFKFRIESRLSEEQLLE